MSDELKIKGEAIKRRIALSNVESKMNYHINHLKIDPIHMYHARKDFPDKVVKAINKMSINGVKIA